MKMRAASVAFLLGLCGAASAQSLRGPAPQAGVPIADLGAQPGELERMSAMAIKPPKPREFQTHQLVTIVVDESSRQEAEQSLKTDKKYDNDSSLGTIIDPWELLETRLRSGETRNLRLLDIQNNSKFDGRGSFERSDRLQMKIQAEIIDVKPNGVLVIEARKHIDKNGETQETILSGQCRQEDITATNTIFSSQLADMSLVTRHSGDVDKAGRKGIVPRVLETLFAF